MASTDTHPAYSKPISVTGRLILISCLLPAAVAVGFAFSVALYQFNRDALRHSELLGELVCGVHQHIDDVPTDRGGARRMICRDAGGTEVSATNNLVAVKFGVPFMLAFALPCLLMAWTLGRREDER